MTNSTAASTAVRPFTIDVPQADLDDLRDRLARTRWVDELPGAGTDYGMPLATVRALADHWQDSFDWRAQEAKLNELPHFVTEIDGEQIHFLHIRSPHADALPLVMTHGWPKTFTELLALVGPLTDPVAHGGEAKDAFHVVIPSPPGYAFSGPTRSKGWNYPRIARAWDTLMKRLGYARYGAQGGDLGSLVGLALGRLAPEGLIGTHVMQIFAFPSGDPAELEKLDEHDRAGERIGEDFMAKAGYHAMSSSRPNTIGTALNDSPAGTLAWLLELPTNWGETPLDQLDKDALLTDVTIYWVTRTVASAARIYYEDAHSGEDWDANNPTPTGVAVFPWDFQSVRAFAERANTNIVHWKRMEYGSHFAAIDAPELLVADLREFYGGLR
ncbi:epoxide hydrolase family protein [Conexibacter woesei]|uniref:Epoxide hydrolase domain protein n=1 Tax=Conexibacter woesei (strain DSM 14684 / CCUG 47730 / CIP 108061 / JCM 11494 / NBRC 100937 / ID131577) TaxID=469383 RepID=D3F648_CONWI|nr:epoxide hydrolase family protein [Conexibacter woesei]ADB48721.1 Epoxide hydrolase domain protein [Conexibacter woesei DSM 14684]